MRPEQDGWGMTVNQGKRQTRNGKGCFQVKQLLLDGLAPRRLPHLGGGLLSPCFSGKESENLHGIGV